jgi:hypothetical protein
MHKTTGGSSPGQKGLQVHFLENVHFRLFSWVIAHDFQHSGQVFCYIPHVHKLLVEHIWRGFHLFLDRRVHVLGRVVAFPTENYLPKRKQD